MVTLFGCCCVDDRGAPRLPTSGDLAKYGERWGRVKWRITEVWLWRWRVRGTWADGDVELHEDRYWDISLCTGVDGSGGVGNSFGVDGCFGVDGTDCVGSGGDVGGDCGDSDNAGSFGGS